ncbi:MAG: TIM barrel protein [Endomicrobiia bacterium]
MKDKIGISTVYFMSEILKNSGNWFDLRKMLDYFELKNLELNTEIPLSWVKDIERDVGSNEVKILSLHNFCPCIENIPKGKNSFNAYLLNSTEETERNLAIKYTLRTIDFAKNFGAEVVVLHAGTIPTNPTGYEFYKFLLNYGNETKLFSKYKDSLIESRKQNQKKYFNLLLESLDKIVPYAEKSGVVLGLETRFFPNEIPNYDEIKIILDNYKTKYFVYWHDFGHAEILSKLGFAPGQKKYFETYKKHFKGFHIHDLKGFEDHFAPGTGEIEFSVIEQFHEQIFILEVHPKEEKKVLKQSINFIENIISKDFVKT